MSKNVHMGLFGNTVDIQTYYLTIILMKLALSKKGFTVTFKNKRMCTCTQQVQLDINILNT